MKQILQDLGSGKTIVADIPMPQVKAGHVLIETLTSLISAGTERMLVDFGRSSYLEKARQQPEKVKMVLDKVKTDGLLPTIDAVRSKLDQPVPMGYSNVGRVVEVGRGAEAFQIGDLVVSNGHHAGMVCVPKNLCAKVPEGVRADDAVFTVVGAIALQGIRIAEPTLGECVVVTGLGLIGLMTVQLLKAQGCRVLGLDFDESKLALARAFGAEVVNLAEGQDPVQVAESFSRGRGVDAVIITASTKSSDPVHQAATMCRKRGRIVLVGVAGLELNRSDFYEKELSFQVSCSYGPGRYDSRYEDEGHDYPVGFVRWTEQRNFEAVLDIMAAGTLQLADLKTRTFPVDSAPEAYQFLLNDKQALGVLLDYPAQAEAASRQKTLPLERGGRRAGASAPVLAAVGAGNYAGRMLLPAFAKTEARLKTVASSGGVTGTHYGKKLGFEQTTTDTEALFEDQDVDAVIVGTQHNSHGRFVIDALKAGKSVFVEKPLALTNTELDQIETAYAAAGESGSPPLVMVGFNRRFAPLMQKLKKATSKTDMPMSIVYTCNAGVIPADSWVQDPQKGGGRIIGEACHFIDIARFLAGSPIISIHAVGMSLPVADCHDTASITVKFENGSVATVHYFANGHRAFPKERVEVFQAGKTFVLDNFRSLVGFGETLPKKRSFSQQKGQDECCAAFVSALKSGGAAPIPFQEVMEVSRASIQAAEMIGMSDG
ncbi:bi-domain-containing oxidoreductase [Kordiimonas sp.]|uniref:bi-domain-containing oxidoreductase n=1 Tax=Kordiimonas sp. TaxID=1970157 RepID=UPI003A93BC79